MNPRADPKPTPKGFVAWSVLLTSSGPGVNMKPATKRKAETDHVRNTHRQRADGMRPVGNRRKSSGRSVIAAAPIHRSTHSAYATSGSELGAVTFARRM